MWPILPFIAGVAVGASALGLARKTRMLPHAREAAQNASEKIRQATISGLDSIQQSSKLWRDRLNDKDQSAKAASANKPAKPAEKAKPAQPASGAKSRASKPDPAKPVQTPARKVKP